MAPVVLFLLFLTITAIPPGAADNEPGGEDESTEISDIISKANENITRGIDFDDIIPSQKRNAATCLTWGRCKWPKYGRYVYIPYVISSRYSTAQRNLIIRAMQSFHRSTCIRFFQWRWWYWRYRDYLYFYSYYKSGCRSFVGRQGWKQYILLERTPHCMHMGVVQHELLHALGFHHEQSRLDRDRYVTVNYQNIIPGKERNFRKVLTNNMGTSYKFNSVMHYSKYLFSKNRKPTIVAKHNKYKRLGSWFMTRDDIARVNKIYRCWLWCYGEDCEDQEMMTDDSVICLMTATNFEALKLAWQ